MQVAAVVLMLPELLTTGHNLWLAGVVAPAISIALSMTPIDPEVMKNPQGKIQASFKWNVSFNQASKFCNYITVFIIN